MPRLSDPQVVAQGAALSISLDGVTYPAIAGESVAAALSAAGCMSLRRDREGRPRGLLCGMGVCGECELERADGVVVRACMTKVEPNMQLRRSSYRSEASARTASQPASPETREQDVLIVGAGPAGISAALHLAGAGLRVTLLDERAHSGGQYFKPLAPSQAFAAQAADAQYREGNVLRAKLAASAVTVFSEAAVWGGAATEAGGFELRAVCENRALRLQAAQLILATGGYERVPPFPGWTLPGVMTTGAAQTLLRAYRVSPGQRVLIAGNGPLNLQLACELQRLGVSVVAVVEAAPEPLPARWSAALGMLGTSPALTLQGLRYLFQLQRAGVPLRYGQRVLEAHGSDRVEQVLIGSAGDNGTAAQSFAIDALCLGYGVQPSAELARAMGCALREQQPGLYVPERDSDGQTSVPGLFAIGDGARLGGAQIAQAEGAVAASAILRQRGLALPAAHTAKRNLIRHQRFQARLWQLYRAEPLGLPNGDTLLCRCECVTAGQVEALIAQGVHDIGGLKRACRVGMGSCQGRYCQGSLAELLQGERGSTSAQPLAFAPRLPVKPVALALLAQEQPEWGGYRTEPLPAQAPRADKPTSAAMDAGDVLIIGAGVVGLCTALALARAGARVTLVDRGTAHREASAGNAGSLHLQMLSADFGTAAIDLARTAATLHLQRAGIEAWLRLQRELSADFEIAISGGLVVAEHPEQLAFLERKAALERQHGVATELLDGDRLRRLLPAAGAQLIGAAYCADEGKINPLKVGPALCAAVEAAGVTMRSQVSVHGVSGSDGHYLVHSSAGTWQARRLVLAAGAWTGPLTAALGVPLPIGTAPQQMLVTEALDPLLDKLVAAAGRHLSLKQVANGNVIIGGGWPARIDPGMRLAVNRLDSIAGNAWVAQRVIPALAGVRVLRSWATVGVMIDGAPIVGPLPGWPGCFLAVGANGYTMGPALGQLLCELVQDRPTSLDVGPFTAGRFAS